MTLRSLLTYKRLIIGVCLEHLANADAASLYNQEISLQAVDWILSAEDSSVAKLGTAARRTGERGTVSATWGLQDHGTISGLSEEVFRAREAMAAFEARSRDLVWMVCGATRQLKEVGTEVKVAAGSTVWVQGRSSRDAESQGKKPCLGVVSDHCDE